MSKRTLASCVCAFGALFSTVTARAQSSASAFDGYTPGQAMLGNPTGTIALSGFETLNPANGQLSINIPLLAVHGRGSVNVPLSVPLNSDVWDATAAQYSYNCNPYVCQTGYGYVVSSTGWDSLPPAFGTGRMLFRSGGDYCVTVGSTQQWNTVLTRATFVAPDGTETEFVDQQTGGTAEPGSAGYNRGTVFNADDGSCAKFTSSSSIADPTSCGAQSWGASGVLVLRDGTTYTISRLRHFDPGP